MYSANRGDPYSRSNGTWQVRNNHIRCRPIGHIGLIFFFEGGLKVFLQFQNTGGYFETSFNVPRGTLNLVSTYSPIHLNWFQRTPAVPGGNPTLGEVTWTGLFLVSTYRCQIKNAVKTNDSTWWKETELIKSNYWTYPYLAYILWTQMCVCLKLSVISLSTRQFFRLVFHTNVCR